MASITLPTPGGDAEVWGDKLNAALNAVNVESSANAANITSLTASKQNKLVAGANITIDVTNPAAPIISSAGSVDAEQVRDIIGAALVGSGNVSVTVNDSADTITISTTATTNSSDAQLRDRSTHTGTQPQSSVVNLVSDLASKVPNSRTIAGVDLVDNVTLGELMNALGSDYRIYVNPTTHAWPSPLNIPAGFTGKVIFNSDEDPNAQTPPSGPDGYYWEKYNAQ